MSAESDASTTGSARDSVMRHLGDGAVEPRLVAIDVATRVERFRAVRRGDRDRDTRLTHRQLPGAVDDGDPVTAGALCGFGCNLREHPLRHLAVRAVRDAAHAATLVVVAHDAEKYA